MSTGFGNRTADEPSVDSHITPYSGLQNARSYQGGSAYGSGATAGVGFGNKTASDPDGIDNSEIRFGTNMDTKPYSGGTRHGSGTTAGAGFGNKTSDVGTHDPRHDSTLGKVMEKVGRIVNHEGLVEKGGAKRGAKLEGGDAELGTD